MTAPDRPAPPLTSSHLISSSHPASHLIPPRPPGHTPRRAPPQAALTAGADLLYLFTAEEACGPIKSYSPELMVTPVRALAPPPLRRR